MEENQIIMNLAKQLIEITTRNTVSYITDKIKTSKVKNDREKTISELEEIIQSLLNDKLEIQRIAKAYEQELIAQKITKEDIKYITDNILPILSELIGKEKEEEFNKLKSLLSVETITIMQLLGFNYKRAIGEPLTLLLQKLIESKIPVDNSVNTRWALTMADIALNKEATERYYKLIGKNDEISK